MSFKKLNEMIQAILNDPEKMKDQLKALKQSGIIDNKTAESMEEKLEKVKNAKENKEVPK